MPESHKGHLVICVDGSKYTETVVSWCRAQLSGYEKVTVLCMVEDHTIDYAMYGPEFIADHRHKAEAKALEVVHGVKDQLNFDSVQCLVALGQVKEGLVTMVGQLGADLVVVGSHGHGGFKRAFLGSVSDYLVHHAKVPVLVIK